MAGTKASYITPWLWKDEDEQEEEEEVVVVGEEYRLIEENQLGERERLFSHSGSTFDI